MSGRSQSTRDVMRQEAKLHEMTEEVRRREIRSNLSQQHYAVNSSRILVSPIIFRGYRRFGKLF